MQIRCNFPDISYLSETQKNNFQFLTKIGEGVQNYLSVPVLKGLVNFQDEKNKNILKDRNNLTSHGNGLGKSR